MTDELSCFYDRLKAGMTVNDFLPELDRVTQFVHEAGMTHLMRLGAKPTKRLSDEIWPVSRWVKQHAAPSNKIQFPQLNIPPDCYIWHSGSSFPHAIEVTIAGAKERRFTMQELNKTGRGRGLLIGGLSDDEPDHRFREEMGRESRAYDNAEVRTAMVTALKRCL